jgi:hypothetical protein
MIENTDPADLLDELDPEAIQARLDDLHRQLGALRILLRAARACRRNRGKRKAPATPPACEVTPADVGRAREGGGR